MELIVIIIALGFSFYYSGSETVFLSSSKVKLEVLIRKGKSGGALVRRYVNDPESYIITTLLGNNIAVVTFSSVFVLHYEHELSHIMTILISSGIALILGEIIPKAIGWEIASRLMFVVTPGIRASQVVFMPLIFFLRQISSLILALFQAEQADQVAYLTKKDMEMFIGESEQAGLVEKSESEIISNLFIMGETIVKETMVPRTEIIALKNTATIQTALRTFRKSGYTRLPVYEKTIDNIVGVIHAKDLFDQPDTVRSIMKPILAVPDTRGAFSLLQEFRQNKTSIAIIHDEYGGTSGLVTFEDLVEELFGEIYDEFDIDHEHLFKKLNAFTYVVKARAEIDELNAKFSFEIPEGEYSTLGGFIIDELGRIPVPDDFVDLENCRLIITKADRKRVLEVKIIKKSKIRRKKT
ncbi:HlyC/CorC family transporter [candidate division KSB1 bacterium]|nr:HlyC/CorC family transporter [candidate division KSB1 bacterium]